MNPYQSPSLLAPTLPAWESLDSWPLRLREVTILSYRQGYRQGTCRLRLFLPETRPLSQTNPAVALVTEMPDSQGLSITNGIEAIANQIARYYGLDPRHTVLIEHYDDREVGTAAYLPGRIDGEKFCCVTFGEMEELTMESPCYQMRRPQWSNLARSEVETLLGCALL